MGHVGAEFVQYHLVWRRILQLLPKLRAKLLEHLELSISDLQHRLSFYHHSLQSLNRRRHISTQRVANRGRERE